jgi:S-adenosylmethionine decarboxylase
VYIFCTFLANKGIEMFKSLSGQLGDRFLTPAGPSDDPLDMRVPASVGSHCILELYDCSKTLLNDANFIQRSLREAATQANATLLNEVLHQFDPQGITALALLSESHISVHTWPEVGYAALDVFTCGHHTDPEEACKYLIKVFQAGRHSMTKIRRNPPPTPLTLSLNGAPNVVADELVCGMPV